MTIKNNLYNPISIVLDKSRKIDLVGKESKKIPLKNKTEHMISLEKLGKIKITEVN
jgi:hypothetical protein